MGNRSFITIGQRTGQSCDVSLSSLSAALPVPAGRDLRWSWLILRILIVSVLAGSSPVWGSLPELPEVLPGRSLQGWRGASSVTTPLLSSFGKGVRTVVLAALQNRGVCRSDNSDWRSALPRYIAGVLPPDSQLVFWDARFAARNTDRFPEDSQFCGPGGVDERTSKAAGGSTFNCWQWFQETGRQSADLVIVLGTGHHDCPECKDEVRAYGAYAELHWVFNQPWVAPATRFVHLPISRSEEVLKNEIEHFDVVLPDGHWIKPIHIEGVDEYREACKTAKRTNTLTYIARYRFWKGQLDFLKAVDPRLLKGFVVEFFTSTPGSPELVERMHSIAAERGISIYVHTDRVDREVMLHSLCSASGHIHFAKKDANPRSLYEALIAGLPAFVTVESNIPDDVLKQEFVFPTRFDPTELNIDFKVFMSYVRSKDRAALDKKMLTFIENDLEENHALWKVCAYLGVCEGAPLEF